jgi:hypothetical protein
MIEGFTAVVGAQYNVEGQYKGVFLGCQAKRETPHNP